MYKCNFCNYKAKYFFVGGNPQAVLTKYGVIGGGRRTHCYCPNCRSKDRDRSLALFLDKELKISKEAYKVLHFAPEAIIERMLRPLDNLDYKTADLLMKNVDYQLDLLQLQIEDDQYDLIICNHVLEHIDNDLQAMQEIFRVLKPGGTAIMQTPIADKLATTLEDPEIIDPIARLETYGQADHVRLYGWDYPLKLRQAGFSLQVKYLQQILGTEAVREAAVIENEPFFIGKKLV